VHDLVLSLHGRHGDGRSDARGIDWKCRYLLCDAVCNKSCISREEGGPMQAVRGTAICASASRPLTTPFAR
jgi:hypothetical protein